MSAAGRLGVGVIGAGNVGPVLALALAGVGHAITGISTVSDDGKERAATLLPDVPVLDIPEVIRRSELVLLAIPGDQIAELVSGLATAGVWVPGQLVVHTSPAHGTGVLQPAMAVGAIPLAIHPAMEFTGTTLDLSRLTGSYAAVTAPAPVLPIAQALAVEMGAEPVVIAETDRPAYAEAISTATEFSRSIVAQASGLLGGIGVTDPGPFLSSLVHSSVDNALRRIPPVA
ncbi:MAG: Rossmann-like and DUF2520 domain-containing protein [Mycetocola sp.]